jgi:putative FmdB family regulatory protein
MPTYEYRCPNGHEFDRFYKTISGAPAEQKCPECGAVAERKISGGAGFAFKGSGFYLTDYGRNAHRKPEPTKAEGGKAEGGKAEGGKAEGGKAEGGKTEGGKAEGGKTASPKVEPSKPKPESAKPSKPKSE